MPDISNVQKSPFLKTKQKKDGGNNKRMIRYRNIFENILKSDNGRRMDLAFLASF